MVDIEQARTLAATREQGELQPSLSDLLCVNCGTGLHYCWGSNPRPCCDDCRHPSPGAAHG